MCSNRILHTHDMICVVCVCVILKCYSSIDMVMSPSVISEIKCLVNNKSTSCVI